MIWVGIVNQTIIGHSNLMKELNRTVLTKAISVIRPTLNGTSSNLTISMWNANLCTVMPLLYFILTVLLSVEYLQREDNWIDTIKFRYESDRKYLINCEIYMKVVNNMIANLVYGNQSNLPYRKVKLLM